MSRTEATRAGRVGRAWREVSSRVYAEETHCWICGDYVDPRLHPRHPRGVAAVAQLDQMVSRAGPRVPGVQPG
uniref:hypothetical protein n=1 Tax=Amycolatopsis pretoriensis TaxID=218821 RepID=UPI001B7FF4DF